MTYLISAVILLSNVALTYFCRRVSVIISDTPAVRQRTATHYGAHYVQISRFSLHGACHQCCANEQVVPMRVWQQKVHTKRQYSTHTCLRALFAAELNAELNARARGPARPILLPPLLFPSLRIGRGREGGMFSRRNSEIRKYRKQQYPVERDSGNWERTARAAGIEYNRK